MKECIPNIGGTRTDRFDSLARSNGRPAAAKNSHAKWMVAAQPFLSAGQEQVAVEVRDSNRPLTYCLGTIEYHKWTWRLAPQAMQDLEQWKVRTEVADHREKYATTPIFAVGVRDSRHQLLAR